MDIVVEFVSEKCCTGQIKCAFPAAVSKDMKKRLKQAGTKKFDLENYRFDVTTDKATLLPKHERTHMIPGNVKGGFGQSNVCYPYEHGVSPKQAPWMSEAVSYILNYDKDNLLGDTNADNDSEEAAAISQERAAGFQSNAVIRSAVEQFAMSKAKAVLIAMGYKNFENTAKFKPYDYTCERHGRSFFVEIKGTQTLGKTLILTRGEVEHVGSHAEECILVLVHSVNVSGKSTIRVGGGTTDVKELWRLLPKDLSPIQYVWKVS